MSRINIPKDLQEWNKAGDGYLPGLVGLQFDKVEADEVIVTMPVKKELCTWNGYLHAASVIALADSACGYGTVASLSDDANGFTTIELKSNFLGTALDGELRCIARPLHQGKNTQVWDAEVARTDNNKIIAHFRCTQMILRS